MADQERPFRVYTDTSDTASGGVLHQVFEDGIEAPVEYKSKKLTPTEQRYSVRDRELLAVVHALKSWRHYLMGKHFVLYTDHESLQFLSTMKVDGGDMGKRVLHWVEFLQQFDFEVKYIKGENNIADALTRNETAKQEPEQELAEQE